MALVAGIGLALAALAAAPVQAQPVQAERTWSLPAASLQESLNRLAQQAGMTLAVDPAFTAGSSAPAVSGSFTTRQVLDRLLADTGLVAVLGDGVISVRRAQAAALPQGPGATLPEVRVAAAAINDASTEHSGSYAPTGPSNAATRMDLSLKETPQSVSVVTRQQMDDFGLDSLNEVLLITPGIASTGRNPDGGGHTFNVRGFDIENVQIDGVQGSYHAAARGSFHGMMSDMLIYDRVEVVRGATGLMSGAGDPSASVNLVRKRPQKTFGANAAVAVGSWSRRQFSADVTSGLTANGGVRGRLIAGWREADSFRRGTSSSNLTVTGVVEADLGPSTLLTLGHDHQRGRSSGNINGGLPLFHADGSLTSLPRSTWLAPRWTHWNKDYDHSFARLQHDFDNGWKAQAAFSHHVNTGDALVVGSAARGGALLNPDGSGIVLNTNLVSQSKRRQDTWEVSATGPFQLWGRSHQLSVGANGSKARNTAYDMGFSPSQAAGSPANEVNFPVPDITAWDGSSMLEPSIWRTGAYSSTHIGHKGLFGAVRFSLADPLHVIAGARWSSYETHRDDFDTQGAYRTTAAVLRNSGVVTPYLGATLDITPATTVYASYTEIFRPQSYRDKDNNFLEPIDGSNVELGIKNTFFDQRLNVNAAVFQARQNNLAEIDDSVPENSLPDGGQAYRSTGKGSKSQGFELELTGALSRDWQVFASYSYTRARDGKGQAINRVLPRSIVRLGSQYRFTGALSGLTMAASLQWQGRKALTRTGQSIPGVGMVDPMHKPYMVANLAFNYHINRHWSAALNINNVFDKKYYDRTQSWGVWYGEPRNVMLTARYTY